LGARFRAGRPLIAADGRWSAVVVNEAFVKRVWPGSDPRLAVGELVTFRGVNEFAQIVGVVQDMFDAALDVKPSPMMYRRLQEPASAMPVHYVARTSGDHSDIEASARRIVSAISPGAVILRSGTIDNRLAATVRDRSFATLIVTLFTVAALSVTSFGLFGIIRFIVVRRWRDIAIRVAIGATTGDVMWVVTREAVVAAAAGACAGCLISWQTDHILRNQLYGLAPRDGVSYMMAAAVMVTVAGLASAMSARAALRINPIEALRAE
jgi:hypothetical protein